MEKEMDKGSQQPIPSYFCGTNITVSTTPISNALRIGFGTPKIESPVVDRSRAYEWTSRVKHEDKQSGSYARYTGKEKASTGEFHVEKGTGRVGVKDEFKKSSTIRVGNKAGYTEYYREQGVRHVDYGKSSITNKSDSDSDSYNDNHYDCNFGYHYDSDSDDNYDNDY